MRHCKFLLLTKSSIEGILHIIAMVKAQGEPGVRYQHIRYQHIVNIKVHKKYIKGEHEYQEFTVEPEASSEAGVKKIQCSAGQH